MWCDVYCRQLRVGNLHLGWVDAGVQFGLYLEAFARGGGANQFDNHLMADQRTPAPVHADMRKQPMFNLIPLARAGWQMTNRHPQTGRICEAVEFKLPQPHAIPVTAASIGADQQLVGLWVDPHANHLPP